jgi:DNA-binding PadR family transcriptional regulator
MNKNTFYSHLKKLREKNLVSVANKERISKYKITVEGLTELNRRLKNYKTLNFNFIDSLVKFFTYYNVDDDEIKIEYLQLANEITRDKLQVFEQSVFDRLLLFLTLNHPRFFPKHSISKGEFLKFNNQNSEEQITLIDLNYFLQQVIEKKFYGIKFWELKLGKINKTLYFRSNSEFGIYFETAIKAYLKRIYYLKNLIKGDISLKEKELSDLIQKIIERLIIPNLFPPSLERALEDLIKEYWTNEFPIIYDDDDIKIISMLMQ